MKAFFLFFLIFSLSFAPPVLSNSAFIETTQEKVSECETLVLPFLFSADISLISTPIINKFLDPKDLAPQKEPKPLFRPPAV